MKLSNNLRRRKKKKGERKYKEIWKEKKTQGKKKLEQIHTVIMKGKEERNHTRTEGKSSDKIKWEDPIPTSNGMIQFEKANSFSTCPAGSQFLVISHIIMNGKIAFYNAVQMEIIQKL